MISTDTLSMVKEMIASPGESAARACAMLAEHEDPRVRLIAEMWAQQSAASNDTESEPADVLEPALEVIKPTPRRTQLDLARIRERLHVMAEELRFQSELLRVVALALGSCHCLGEDPDCEDCRGRGVPGTLEPDRASFARFVLPAVRKMKDGRRGTAAQVPPQESTGRDEAPAERSSS